MRKQYSKSEIKEFIQKHPEVEGIMTKKSSVVETDESLTLNNKTIYLKIEDNFIPHLKFLLEKPDLLPQVTVDMGAVKFVIKGADIMRPGITKAQDYPANSFVVVVDENNSKPLAVCKSELSSTDLMNASEGKVLKNLHYVGDKYWSS